MKVVVRFSGKEELKALPILLRQLPGMILRGRTYILEESAARALRSAGVQFDEVSREAHLPRQEGVSAGESL